MDFEFLFLSCEAACPTEATLGKWLNRSHSS